jgi:hypothetical protein
MKEFLVKPHDAAKYIRVLAENEQALELEWNVALVFSSDGKVFKLEPEKPIVAARDRLPFKVQLAWFALRFPKVRMGFQVICWLILSFLLLLEWLQISLAPAWLILLGGLNIFAWWWFDLELTCIEPGVRVVLK